MQRFTVIDSEEFHKKLNSQEGLSFEFVEEACINDARIRFKTKPEKSFSLHFKALRYLTAIVPSKNAWHFSKKKSKETR